MFDDLDETLAVIFESTSLEEGKVGCAFMKRREWNEVEAGLYQVNRRPSGTSGFWKWDCYQLTLHGFEIKTICVSLLDKSSFEHPSAFVFVSRPSSDIYDPERDDVDLDLSHIQKITARTIITQERADRNTVDMLSYDDGYG